MTRFRAGHALVLTLFVSGLVAPPPARAQTLKGLWYEDATKGFRFRIPTDYAQVPLQESERWTVALFQSDKEYAGSVKDGDSGWPHKPMLKVIMFDEDAIKRSDAVELEGGTTIKIGRPYRDYKDYVKSNLPGGGYFFETEEEGKVGGISVTEYEIKVEKLAQDRLRYLTWVYHGEGYDFALEVELLEAQYRKLRNPIISSFKSFKFIEREGISETVNASADAAEADNDTKPWDKMTVKERMDWRVAQEDRREARLRAKLPDDWDVIKTDQLLILTHAGRSYTNQIRTMAEAARKYMEDRFGALSDEYVRRTVIRICKDFDEYIAYYTGGSADSFLLFAFGDGEITDYSESTASFSMIFDGVAWHYLSEKMRSYFDIPYWLRQALDGYFSLAQFRSRRIIFDDIPQEREAFVSLLRDRENRNLIKTPQELMQLTAKDVSAGLDKDIELRWQFLTLLRFLEGPGKKHKLLRDRDFLIEYIALVDATTQEFEKENPSKHEAIKQATTEEEEERQKQERTRLSKESAKRAEEREKELLALVAQKAFNWSPSDWESLSKAYESYWRSR